MRVLVLGGAECVWDDVRASEEQFGTDWWDVCVAVNDCVTEWPRPVDYLVSRHPNKMDKWLEVRERNGHPMPVAKVVRRASGQKYGDIVFPDPHHGGDSGLLAAAWALEIGGTRVVLCGIPMDKVPHFDESTEHPTGKVWAGMTHRKKWRANAGRLVGLVKSMSMTGGEPSFTRTLLGAPTPEWLEDDHNE